VAGDTGALATRGAAASGLASATAIELLDAGSKARGGVAGARASASRSSLAIGIGFGGVDAEAAVAGAAGRGWEAAALAGGSLIACGALSAGIDTGACSVTVGASGAGSGSGCKCGSSAAAAGCGAGVTLRGATDCGTSIWIAMAGTLAGTGMAPVGKASDAGGRIGRLPSTCGGRTGSGCNGGGAGGSGVGIDTTSAGGSEAGEAALGSGSGAGAGGDGAGDVSTMGCGGGAGTWLALAIAGDGGFADAFVVRAAVFAPGSWWAAGGRRCPW
jgi:hypothetical protein